MHALLVLAWGCGRITMFSAAELLQPSGLVRFFVGSTKAREILGAAEAASPFLSFQKEESLNIRFTFRGAYCPK